MDIDFLTDFRGIPGFEKLDPDPSLFTNQII